MGDVSVIDCTLRDGGCVNNFNFGQEYMEKIILGLQGAEIDAIECGYLDDHNGSSEGRTQFINEQAIEKSLLIKKRSDILYLAMMDYGKYDPDNLPMRSDVTIDGIRLAFHKEDIAGIISVAKKILAKGYELYIQPMITIRYKDEELLELIRIVNKELPETRALYIVDSFGEMRGEDVKRCIYLLNHNLRDDVAIGFHSHNNLQLSYANAIEIINMQLDRAIYLDSSILGMGKGAGNLNTELLLEYLNFNKNSKYKIAPLLRVIDEVLNQIKEETPWGYSIEYYLSSVNHCSPSYAGYLFNKHTLTVGQISEILSSIESGKRISFDKSYMESLYTNYNKRKEDDALTVSKLRNEIGEKSVLLIAPGKSILLYGDKINSYLKREDVYSIAVNADIDFSTDITIITKNTLDLEKINKRHKIIISSNVQSAYKAEDIIDYEKWVNTDGEARDAAIVIILNILKFCEIKEVFLAGFDGFSVDINENYFNKLNRRPMKQEQVDDRNKYIQTVIKNAMKVMNITFITPTKYRTKSLGEIN